jgi:hypothetical protein
MIDAESTEQKSDFCSMNSLGLGIDRFNRYHSLSAIDVMDALQYND